MNVSYTEIIVDFTLLFLFLVWFLVMYIKDEMRRETNKPSKVKVKKVYSRPSYIPHSSYCVNSGCTIMPSYLECCEAARHYYERGERESHPIHRVSG